MLRSKRNVDELIVDAGDDLRLGVVSSGTGPALLFLHGFTGSVETWSYFRSRLETDFRVVAVDLPGHGASSSPDDPARYAIDRFAGDLVTVLDHLAIDRASLFGYSMGGRIALRFSVNHPRRIDALIVESTSSGIEDDTQRADRIAHDESLADDIEARGVADFVARWERLSLWNSQASLPDSIRGDLREQRMRNSPRGLANSLRGAGAGADPSITGKLGRIGAPTLILAGALDPVYIERGQQLASLIPRAQLTIIEQAGHAIHIEKPDAVVDSVVSFLGEPRTA